MYTDLFLLSWICVLRIMFIVSLFGMCWQKDVYWDLWVELCRKSNMFIVSLFGIGWLEEHVYCFGCIGMCRRMMFIVSLFGMYNKNHCTIVSLFGMCRRTCLLFHCLETMLTLTCLSFLAYYSNSFNLTLILFQDEVNHQQIQQNDSARDRTGALSRVKRTW